MSKKKKKFDLESFKQNKDACVHCKTENEAKQFLQFMVEHNIISYARSKELMNRYSKYKEKTVYYSDGCFDNIRYANHCGHPIMMFDKYDFGEEVNGYGT